MTVAERLRTFQDSMQPLDVGIPGPSSQEMARDFLSIRADPLSFLGEVAARHGDLVSFPVPGAPAVLVNDPEVADHVLRASARTWTKDTVQYAALARVTGPGLLASAEPSWIDHRRLAAPAFHHERLTAVGDQVRVAASSAVATHLQGLPERGARVDVASLTHRIGLDAVGRALFSDDLSDRADGLLTATSDASDIVVRLGRSVLPRAEWTPTRTNLRLRRARRRLDAAAAEIIARRRGRASGPTGSAGGDLVGLLLDSGLSDTEVRDELVTMVIAGHETVAAALAWTLMLLAEHPVAQEKVRAELAALPGPVPLTVGRDQVPWTRAVVDEALRLFPPAWVVSRRSTGEDQLGGHRVPAGTLAIISPWLLHRRPDPWGSPEEFRPERFLGEAAAGRRAYLPFGQGPRLCIGRDFALGEMVIVLAELLREHRVDTPTWWRRPAPRARVAVHPDGGMPLLVAPLPGRVR